MNQLKANNKEPRARFRMQENVEYVLKDKDGNLKSFFVENFLGKKLLSYFRSLTPKPISDEGTVKPGLLNYLAAYGLRIPFVTGMYTTRMEICNLVTNAGKAGVASRINGSGGEAAFTYIATGTGTTAANAADTTLETEITDSGLERANATASRVTVDVTNDAARLVQSFSVTGTKAVTESGVLNAGASGVLLCRQVFSAVNVVNGDTLQVTWTIDVD